MPLLSAILCALMCVLNVVFFAIGFEAIDFANVFVVAVIQLACGVIATILGYRRYATQKNGTDLAITIVGSVFGIIPGILTLLFVGFVLFVGH